MCTLSPEHPSQVQLHSLGKCSRLILPASKHHALSDWSNISVSSKLFD